MISKASQDIHDLQARGHDPIDDVGSTASMNVGLFATILNELKGSTPSEFCERATRAIP